MFFSRKAYGQVNIFYSTAFILQAKWPQLWNCLAVCSVKIKECFVQICCKWNEETKQRVTRQETGVRAEQQEEKRVKAEIKLNSCYLYVFSRRRKLIIEAAVMPRSWNLRRTRPKPSCQSHQRPTETAAVLPVRPIRSLLTAATVKAQVEFIPQTDYWTERSNVLFF